jgi:hypothetical protein
MIINDLVILNSFSASHSYIPNTFISLVESIFNYKTRFIFFNLRFLFTCNESINTIV